ncbi:hypothetical protein ACJX0J_004831 [Zea mays]
MPIGVPKDTFFSDIFFAYYRARTPEFLLEIDLNQSILYIHTTCQRTKGVNLPIMDSSQYLLMKERAPVGAHLRLNRVITQQVRRAFGFSYSKLIHNLNIQE